MIRLTLTVAEAELIEQRLETCDLATNPVAQSCLDKMVCAQEQATKQGTCSVCQETLTQLKSGRSAQYCSTACKQKAYRIRRNEAKRQYGLYSRS